MKDVILILIAGLIVISIGCPFVEAFSRWKKEMKEAEANEKNKDE